jgi:hypothetical protein
VPNDVVLSSAASFSSDTFRDPRRSSNVVVVVAAAAAPAAPAAPALAPLFHASIHACASFARASGLAIAALARARTADRADKTRRAVVVVVVARRAGAARAGGIARVIACVIAACIRSASGAFAARDGL